MVEISVGPFSIEVLHNELLLMRVLILSVSGLVVEKYTISESPIISFEELMCK